MINPIWLAPVVAGVAYLYFKWEDREWEENLSLFWNSELGTVNNTDLQRFMSYKPIVKGQKKRGLPAPEKIDFKTRVIGAVRELLEDMEYFDNSRVTEFDITKGIGGVKSLPLTFDMQYKDITVTFWLGNSLDFRRVYKVETTVKFCEGELNFVNDLLTDKDKQTIQNYKEFLANGG